MNTDILSAHIIADLLDKNCVVQVLDTVDSTNTYAKPLECSESPALVIANEQTNGRGRLGRSF